MRPGAIGALWSSRPLVATFWGDLVGRTRRYPYGVAVDAATKTLYIADNGNHAVRAVDLDTGAISTVAGQLGSYGSIDGPATSARLKYSYPPLLGRLSTS